jgi:two-component system CheB/CheR fusion protein
VLAKPAHEEKTQVDFSALLHDTVNLMSPQAATQNIKIGLEIEPGLPFVMGVRNQLKQVMINLLKNSIEALEEDKGEIMITATYEAEHMFITVEDNGKGIEPELISKLGTPFFSTKDSGTGLGLMISYRIIQNHEGEIKVESKPGVSTKFQIILPVK